MPFKAPSGVEPLEASATATVDMTGLAIPDQPLLPELPRRAENTSHLGRLARMTDGLVDQNPSKRPTFRDVDESSKRKAEDLLDGLIVALQDFSTEDLESIAEYRDAIHPGGWMQTMIREYVDVWR